MLNVKQGGIQCHFLKVLGMARPGIEPWSPGPLTNTLPIKPTSGTRSHGNDCSAPHSFKLQDRSLIIRWWSVISKTLLPLGRDEVGIFCSPNRFCRRRLFCSCKLALSKAFLVLSEALISVHTLLIGRRKELKFESKSSLIYCVATSFLIYPFMQKQHTNFKLYRLSTFLKHIHPGISLITCDTYQVDQSWWPGLRGISLSGKLHKSIDKKKARIILSIYRVALAVSLTFGLNIANLSNNIINHTMGFCLWARCSPGIQLWPLNSPMLEVI